MEPEEIVEQLTAHGIVAETDDGASLQLTSSFEAELADEESRLADREASVRDLTVTITGSERRGSMIAEDPDGARFLALYEVVSRIVPDGTTYGTKVQMLAILDYFLEGMPPIDGVPDRFVPVNCDRVRIFLGFCSPAVVYVWRDDCRPCSVMRANLEEAVDDLPADVALFGVFGPDCPALLHDEFGVAGGPTTLFTIDGAVDARLVGPYATEIVANEIDKLRELAG